MFTKATLTDLQMTDQGIIIFIVTYEGDDVKPITRRHETAGLLKDSFIVNEANTALDLLNASRDVANKLTVGDVLVQRP